MLLTVTSNATIDRTLYIPHLTIGEVHRATSVHLAAGGKGLNVTRAARILNCPVLATGPLAGHAGRLMADLAVAEGIRTDWYWLPSGETRTCTLVNHDKGDTTVLNEPGEPLTAADWAGFAAHVEKLAGDAQAVAFSGSLPPGVEPAALSVLARSLVTAERPVYLDTSVAALRAALAQPSGLCLKVNRAELAEAWGETETDFATDKIIAVGQKLLERGAALVMVTLGGAGALAITPAGVWQAGVPPVEVVSTVGSGDSFLAGLAVARLRGHSIEEALAYGIACGAANATTRLPARFEREMIEALVKQIEIKRKT
ncbi:MAG: 1-phosphofructokinase family hexose kinase [Anaerolineae bacterium]|nr:1-phosphofructokinase family hexose kinase [Anaerolineae bacterium]